MKYDFDKIIDRHNTGSLKWDVAYNELPMWVADMDFETAPEIIDALKKRVEHGVFGYSILPKEWEDAYITWWRDRHNFEIEPEWLTFCTGVVPAISSIVRKITTPAEKVLIQTPVYNIFFNSILNNGRNVIESELVYDGKDYHIDFEDLEEKLADPQTSLMILCNPHNPVGKIWDKDTLSKIGELCYKHNVVVLSDEIHCDITDPDSNYVPFASVSDICKDNSITCIAPTKAFNIAGLQTAAVVIPNKNLHHKVWRGLNTDEVAEPNAFAVAATVAAFNEGGEWLNELKRYITDNKAYVREFIERELPMLNLTPSKATYLLWLDCSNVTDDATVFADQIREYNGLYLSAGRQFGECGKCFLRLNTACPRSVLEDGMNRFKDALLAIGSNKQ